MKKLLLSTVAAAALTLAPAVGDVVALAQSYGNTPTLPGLHLSAPLDFTGGSAASNEASTLTNLGGVSVSNFGSTSFVSLGSGTSSLSLSTRLSYITDARNFGVKCDGVTDDTTAIGIADAAAGANALPGNVLQFPTGLCLFTSVVRTTNVTWRGTGRPAGNATTKYLQGTTLRATSTTITGPAISTTGGTSNSNAVSFLDMGITSANTATYSYLATLTNWESSQINNTVWSNGGAAGGCLDLVNQNPNGGTSYPEAWEDVVTNSTLKCGGGDMLENVTDSVFSGDYFAGSTTTGTPGPIVTLGGGDNQFTNNMVDNNPNGYCLELTPLVSGGNDLVETVSHNKFQNCQYGIVATASSPYHFGDSIVANIFSRNATNTLGDILLNNAYDFDIVANHQDYYAASTDVLLTTTGTTDYLDVIGNGTEYANWSVSCTAHDNIWGNGPNQNCLAGTVIPATGGFTAGPNFPYIPTENQAYFPLGATNAAGLSTATPTTSRIYYVPFTVPGPISLSQLGIIVTTLQASDACNVGIYSSQTVSGQTIPNALLVSTGPLSVGATGNIVDAPASISLSGVGTIYWYAVICNSSTAVLRALSAGSMAPALGIDPGASSYYQYLYTTGSGTTLPSPASATPSNYSLGGAGGSTPPLVVGVQ